MCFASVGPSHTHAAFRPFKENNSRAFLFSEGLKLASRDAIMQQPVCAERLVSAVDAAEAEGFTWNAVGCSFPPSWPFDSDASQLIRNFTLFTGSPYQRMVEDILLRHDHMNASRARLRCEAQADPLLRGLACDGFAQTHDWGLPVAFVEAIAREAYATLDARVEAKGHDIAVLSSNARLRTLESPQGQRWIRNSSLLHAAVNVKLFSSPC